MKRKQQMKFQDIEDQFMSEAASSKNAINKFVETVDDANNDFELLDSQLNQVGNTAIRIGEQLENIDKHRTRASDAKDIINYFLEFNDNSTARLDSLRQSSNDGEFKTGIVARRLSTIAKEVDVLVLNKAKPNIERYCEDFEKTLLQEFEQAYSEENLAKMEHIAKTLVAFNGGSSCLQTYVAQHSFFINLLKVESGTPMQGEKDNNSSLVRLYEEILQTVTNEWDVIYQIFPNASAVMHNFLQRIFAQSIQNFLEHRLVEDSFSNPLDYLKALESAHKETVTLANSLRDLDQNVIAPAVGSSSLSDMITRAVEDLFVPYVDNNRYIDSEKSWLTQEFDIQLGPFRKFMTNRIKQGKKYTRLVGTAPPPQVNPMPAVIPVSTTNFFFATMNSLTAELSNQNGTTSPLLEDVGPEDAGSPSVKVVLHCIQANLDSIKRCVELSHPSKVYFIL